MVRVIGRRHLLNGHAVCIVIELELVVVPCTQIDQEIPFAFDHDFLFVHIVIIYLSGWLLLVNDNNGL